MYLETLLRRQSLGLPVDPPPSMDGLGNVRQNSEYRPTERPAHVHRRRAPEKRKRPPKATAAAKVEKVESVLVPDDAYGPEELDGVPEPSGKTVLQVMDRNYKGWLIEVFDLAGDQLWRRAFVLASNANGIKVRSRSGEEKWILLEEEIQRGHCRLLYKV